MSELKPCPFCGGEAAMWEGRYSEDSFADKPWVVRCKSCDARMAIMPEYGDGNYWWIHGDEGVFHMRDVITESWNTRAERTCKQIYPNDSDFRKNPVARCSECMRPLVKYESGELANFCHFCGARVVSE